MKKVIVGVIATILIVLMAGMTYEALSAMIAARNHPAPGKMVNVGDFRLHLHTMGEAQDKPTVILDHGGGSMSMQWGWVQPAVAEHTQVVAYDRPGLGWSEASPRPLEPHEAIDALYTALQQEQINGPYILVGHSMGALMVRAFAARYPDEVAGLVLVDPRDVDWEGIYSAEELEGTQSMISTMTMLSRLGIIRLSGMAAQDAQGLPDQQLEQAIAILPSSRHVQGMVGEMHLGNRTAELLKTGESLEEVPLVVLTATQADGAFDARQREILLTQHARLAARSAHGTHQLVSGAGHISIVTQQEYAQAVVDTIVNMLMIDTELATSARH